MWGKCGESVFYDLYLAKDISYGDYQFLYKR